MGSTSTLLVRELREEFRTRETLSLVVLFALLVDLLYSAALGPFPEVRDVAPGLLWLLLLFTAMLTLPRGLAKEREAGTLEGLLASPAPAGSIYLAKMLAGLLFLLASLGVAFPVFFVLLGYPYPASPGGGLGVLALGAAGMAAVGSVFSLLLVQARAREMLLPVLLAPVLFPFLLSGVAALRKVLLGFPEEAGREVLLLAVYTGVMLTLALLTAEFALEE